MTSLKEGNVYSYALPQNTANYQVRVALIPKGLWLCILDSVLQWKLTLTQELVDQTVAKASAGQESFIFRDFAQALLAGLQKSHPRWSVGIMTPTELDALRGASQSKASSSNKLYLIVSDKEKK